MLRYAIDTGSDIYHAVGANAMGPEADDVVDLRLRVRGVTGLRVVDASVLPAQFPVTPKPPLWPLAGSPPTSFSGIHK